MSDEFGNSTTTSWFYSGGWAYRNDGTTFDDNVGFVEDDWTFAPDALDKECPENPFPLGTYNTGTTTPSNPPCTITTTDRSRKKKKNRNLRGVDKALLKLNKDDLIRKTGLPHEKLDEY